MSYTDIYFKDPLELRTRYPLNLVQKSNLCWADKNQTVLIDPTSVKMIQPRDAGNIKSEIFFKDPGGLGERNYESDLTVKELGNIFNSFA